MVSVLHKELEGKVGKLKCKTLEVMKNEKQKFHHVNKPHKTSLHEVLQSWYSLSFTNEQ